jgi:hypothetical protein
MSDSLANKYIIIIINFITPADTYLFTEKKNSNHMKNIIVNFDFENVSAEQYNNVWADLRATGNGSPKGLLFHAGGPRTGSGWKVVDLWESEEAFQNFGPVLMPLLEKHNIPIVQPEVIPAQYVHERQAEIA